MADITNRYVGESVADDAGANARGDQVSAPVGQSIFKTSTVQLDQLGARKVVGDRVFRYALSAATILAAETVQQEEENADVMAQTLSAVAIKGAKQVTMYGASAVASGAYNDGYLHMQTLGHTYKIKSQAAISSAGIGIITLYEPIATNYAITDVASILKNPYQEVIQGVEGAYVGVAPIPVASGDYFWVQTWGPIACSNDDAGIIGQPMQPSTSGTIGLMIATTGWQLGWPMQVSTAAERCLTWLTIAP